VYVGRIVELHLIYCIYFIPIPVRWFVSVMVMLLHVLQIVSVQVKLFYLSETPPLMFLSYGLSFRDTNCMGNRN